tara:strand:+ start:849 stop:1448 length:600 start_codon:yes stop_codon:yes gene_type:complete
MAISTSEAILRRQGGGPSYADLQSPPGQSPLGQNFNLELSPFDTLGETFTRGLNLASKSVSDFFTASPVAPLSNTLGKIGDAVSFFSPFGYVASGIGALGEFSALNESLANQGVPENQQLGIMDALYAALPGPTLQDQYAKALNEYNESIPAAFSQKADDYFDFEIDDYGGGSDDSSSPGSSGGGMSDGTSDGDPSGPI